MVASAGAIAVGVGPLIGGLFTTYLSWRLVFVGEVLVVLVILVRARRIHAEVPDSRPSLDLVGTVLSALGLGADRLRDPASRRVGICRPEARSAVMARTVAHDLDVARQVA